MSLVMKFGGSSVADAERMRRVADLARSAASQGALVVLSAAGRTTDALLAAARHAEAGHLQEALAGHHALTATHRALAEALFPDGVPSDLQRALADLDEELDLLLRGVALLQECSPRSRDAIASVGERLSTRILAAFLGSPWIDARKVLRTDATFGAAQPQPAIIRTLAREHLAPHLHPGGLAVTQGFIGATAEGLTTTLGRGGSDYSASLFGAALEASEIQIWTDVEGVLTCDPRVVPEAQAIPELSFAEAAELAAFGAKVLHPATLEPAMTAGIPVTVRHTLRPEGRFTTITARPATGRPATALACRGPVTVLTVASSRMLNQSGFLARLFEVFRRHRTSVDLVATAEVSVSLTVDADAPLDRLRTDLEAFARVEVAEDRAIVALVGERLKATPGVTGRAFGALGDLNVEMISLGANEINLSLVVRHDEAPEALRRLHAAFFEEAP